MQFVATKYVLYMSFRDVQSLILQKVFIFVENFLFHWQFWNSMSWLASDVLVARPQTMYGSPHPVIFIPCQCLWFIFFIFFVVLLDSPWHLVAAVAWFGVHFIIDV